MSDDPHDPSAPPRRILGTTARRVVFAILVTALIPLLAGTFTARALLARVSATAFQPEFGAHLDQALGVYADLARSLKQEMRAEAEAIAAREPLRTAAAAPDRAALDAELALAFTAHPSLVELRVVSCGGADLARRVRAEPVDPASEHTLTVPRGFEGASAPDPCAGRADGAPAGIVATFAAPRARLDELAGMVAFTQAYHQLERDHRAQYLDQTYFDVFAALLAATLVLAVAAGVLVARPVTRSLARLTAAMRPVAEGDLSVRAAIAGNDEVAELGRAFDRMLEELDQSRARVEFLKRVGEWQKMARRLAHEIKNPLTPIQLAVEECHRRYRGDDAEFRRVLQTTYEVVEEEVGSLRRLVTEFSSFARLPRATLRPGDLGELLREQAARFDSGDAGDSGDSGDAGEREADDPALFTGIDVVFEVPAAAMPAALDAEMLHRVLGNLLRNAVQAIRGAEPGQPGKVRVSAWAEGSGYVITVDDDGPGIPEEVAQALFDPYVTTRRDGTGLGLSIVKKIVVDHGGTITAGSGPLGGARLRLFLPRLGSAAAQAALEKGEPGPESRGVAGPPSRSALGRSAG